MLILMFACSTTTSPSDPSATAGAAVEVAKAPDDTEIKQAEAATEALLADFAFKQGDIATADEHTKKALALDPNNSDALSLSSTLAILTKLQTWNVTTDTDKMDGTSTVSAQIEAVDTFRYHTGEYKRPTLVVRCTAGKLEAYFVNDAMTQDAYDGAAIRVKFDDGKPARMSASESTDGGALFVRKPKDLVAGLSGHTTMLYQFTPYGSADATVTFKIAGWDDVAAPLKAACRLK
jgi:hypothetical protein